MGIGDREDGVVLAPDDLGGYADTMEPFLQIQIVAAWLPCETRGNFLITNKPLGNSGVGDLLDRLISQCCVVECVLRQLLVSAQENIDARNVGHMDSLC